MTTKNILKIGTLALAFFSAFSAIPVLAKSGKEFFRAKQKNVKSYKSRRKSPNHLRVPGRDLPIKNGQILAKGQSENSSGQAVRKPFRDTNGYCVVSINDPESIIKANYRQPVESVEGSYVEMNHSSVSLSKTLLCNGDYLVEYSSGAMINLVGDNSENTGYTILKTKNKDVIFIKSRTNNSSKKTPRGTVFMQEANGEIIGGTGKFVNVTGHYHYKTKFLYQNKNANGDIKRSDLEPEVHELRYKEKNTKIKKP